LDDILENPVEATVGKRLLDTVGYVGCGIFMHNNWIFPFVIWRNYCKWGRAD